MKDMSKVFDDSQVNQSFSENALKVMRKRYLNNDEQGNQETPAQMFRRVSRSLAEVERDYGRNNGFVKKIEDDFFEIMANQEFTPAGRTLKNAGSKTALIANCIVLPINDSMDGIFQTLKEASLLQQAGSGLGFSLDDLRPAMAPTVKSQGVASGPVSFLKIYNEAFGTIKQQERHGANMAMMSIDHPDILDFVRAKMVEGEIANFNISVKVTDEFMDKLKNYPNDKWHCSWKGEKMKPRKVLRHPNGNVYDIEELDLTVGDIFDEIAHYAWTNGEPGIAFVGEWERTNPLPGLGPIPATNPCGEQALHPYDNCNLGSINLSRFVRGGNIDYNRLQHVTSVAVRMLDNVIDRFDFPVSEVNDMAKNNRRIGLGTMGFADMLYQLGIRYDSEEGIRMAENVMSAIQTAAEEMSTQLAREKGPFPNYTKSVFTDGSRRNAALTTVAPTGSIAMMLNTSSGVEPNFALSFVKQDKDGAQYHYLNHFFLSALKETGLNDQEIDNIKAEAVKKGSIQHLDHLHDHILDTFVTAMDITGTNHIKVQAAFQKYVDNSISKTINLPNKATVEDVKQSFILAWELRCKSCTVYRDGSRQVQVLNIGDGKDLVAPSSVSRKDVSTPFVHSRDKLTPRERPDVIVGKTYKVKTGYGNLYITVNDDEGGDPFEIFTTIGKTGGFFQEQSEAISRLISLSLRAGVSARNVIDQIRGIRGPMPIFTNKGTILSLPDAIARVLEEHVGLKEDFNDEESSDDFAEVTSGYDAVVVGKETQFADYGIMPGCPDCGSALQIGEGCMSCRNCGFSRCG